MTKKVVEFHHPVDDNEHRDDLNGWLHAEPFDSGLGYAGAAYALLAANRLAVSGTVSADLSVPAAALGDEPVLNASGDPVTPAVRSGNPNIDGSLIGSMWADGFISYSDPDAPGDYQPGYYSDLNANSVSVQNEAFGQLSSQQLAAAHFALSEAIYTQAPGAAGFSVEGFTNLNIDYAGSGVSAATIRLANSSDPRTSYAFYPSTFVTGGDVWFGTSARTPVAGNYSWFTTLHEIGHALGLKHGHEDFTPSGNGPLPTDVNSLEFSLMTYSNYIGQTQLGAATFEFWGAPQTFMMLDVAALQYMYGADYTTNSTDTVYTWSPTAGDTFVNGVLAIHPGANRIFATIWDGGGTDTYDLSNYTTNLNVDLVPGDFSVFSAGQLSYLGGGPNAGYARGNIFNALTWNGDNRSLIENAIGGSGADILTGNAVANTLRGNFGNDALFGAAGDDTLFGGEGDDTLDGGAGADRLSGETGDDTSMYDPVDSLVDGGPGTDILRIATSGTTLDLTSVPDDVITGIEIVDLTGTGNNNLVLRLGDVLALTSTAGTLRIEGNAGDQVIAADAESWTRVADQVNGNNTYRVYTQGPATLLIDTDVTTLVGTTRPIVTTAGGTTAFTETSNVSLQQGSVAAGASPNHWRVLSDEGVVVDNQGQIWTLVANVLHVNGVSFQGGWGDMLVWEDGVVYHRSPVTGAWYYWDPSGYPHTWVDTGTDDPETRNPVAIDSALTVSDADNATLASATVTITGHFQPGQDVLVFVNDGHTMGNIVGSYAAAAGVLTLSSAGAAATVAQWQAALRAVTYSDASERPDTGTRTLTFQVNDGSMSSDPATKLVSVTSVNDAPVNTVPNVQRVQTSVDLVIGGTRVTDSDADTLQVTLSAQRGVISLAAGSTGALQFSAGDGLSDATMSFSGSIANVNTALATLNYHSNARFVGIDVITVMTSDLGATGAGGALGDTDSISIRVGDARWTSHSDANVDGKSDMLWRTPQGQTAMWLMDGTTITRGAYLSDTMPLDWNIVNGYADYNGDGKSDLLWRGPHGEVTGWLMDGVNVAQKSLVANLPAGWSVIDAQADYNGDGNSDLLWRTPQGQSAMWLMDGTTITRGLVLPDLPSGWAVVDGHGDYNSDGKGDLLWRGPQGQTALWLMDGVDIARGLVLTSLPPDWSLLDAQGDYNGDGKSDLLWRTSQGQTAMWLMDGTTITRGLVLPELPAGWSLANGHADYNADGKSDLLWRGPQGELTSWLMDGVDIARGKVVASLPLNWHIVDSHGDYNGDGKSDIIWSGPQGEVTTWLMDGVDIAHGLVLTNLPAGWSFSGEPGATLVGDAGNNTLTGTVTADTLRGGAGADTLRGNAGADRFVFDAPLNATTNVDTVVDFTSGEDKLALSDVIFTSLPAGPLSAGSLVSGTNPTAQDANDFVLYNTSTGRVSYDADGSGPGSAIAFATLFGNPALSANDVYVIPG